MNPHNDVVQNPSTRTRQTFLIFAMLVAGKTSTFAVAKTRELHDYFGDNELPFNGLLRLDRAGKLPSVLREVGTGRYAILEGAFRDVAARVDVDRVTIPELMMIRGIGPKTANYFFMYGRKGEASGGAIDTHMKKFLRDCGLGHLRGYGTMSREFVLRAQALGLSTPELDNLVWRHFARKEATGYANILDALRLKGLAPDASDKV